MTATVAPPTAARPSPVNEPPLPRPLLGIGLMFLSAFLFASMHASIRHVAAELHPFQIAFFRNLFGLVFVLPWLIRYGLAPLRTKRLKLHGVRAVINLFAMLSFFYAVSITPLSEVTALGFTAPIFATVLAALFLGEAVRARRWTAILVGFCGTLIIVRPGFQEIGLGQILVLFSAMVWACALLIIKSLSKTEASVTIIAYMALLLLPMSAVPAAYVWQTPTSEQLYWLALIGLIGGGAQWFMTEALRRADTAVVMPVDFCKLIWATLIAYLAFGEVPDRYTWIGGTVIFASTLYIVYRERVITQTPD